MLQGCLSSQPAGYIRY